MLKKIIAMSLCVMFLSMTAAVFAEDVYVTAHGKKYHKADCRFVKNKDTQKISKEEAIAMGLKPCGRCFKEDLASDVADGNQKASVAKKDKTDQLSKLEKSSLRK